jgi:uncharacterized membrane protein
MEGTIGLIVLAVLSVPVLLGVALVLIFGLRSRVAALEAQVAGLQAGAAAEGGRTLDGWMRGQADAPAAAPVAPRPATPPVSEPMSMPGAASAEPPSRGTAPTEVPRDTPPPVQPPRRPAGPSRPDPLTLAARAARRWFTEGNVPVKVGMLVLFAGVAALLKYASDQGWMSVPVELRLAGIALAALGGLVFGWRQREVRRSFALSLQGGAIGVLLLVVFAAVKLYALLPAGAAFGLSVVLVAGIGVLAVAQNALALAVLGILAGFLAPIWLSTGQGSHVALFGYYAILNAGVFAIAWVRPWRMLNALGFAFTFGIGSAWGVSSYRPEHFPSVEPFLLLFFAFYLLIPILYARRRAPGRRDFVDGCLLFGTPLVAFSLQAGLLEGERLPLAFCALGLGALYGALAVWLRRREHFEPLVAPYAVLAAGFATLAVPLALSASASACVFALEGAAAAWLGLRQRRRLPQVAAVLLQAAAAVGFFIGVEAADASNHPVANAAFMSALLIAFAGFASAWSYRRAGNASAAAAYYAWGLVWWLGNGFGEIDRFVVADLRTDALLLFSIATGWLAAETYRRDAAPALAWTAMAALASALPLAWAQDSAHVQPFAQLGLVAWVVYAVVGWRVLRILGADEARGLGAAHTAWLLAWALAVSLGLHELARHLQLGEGWRIAFVALPWLALAALVQWRPHVVARPLAGAFERWRTPLQQGLIALLAMAAAWAVFVSGDSAPLPWLPLLNPLDLAQLGVLVVLAGWLDSPLAPASWRTRRWPLLAAAGFVLVSTITLRAAHHWGGVDWDGSLPSSTLVQTSLTVVWSLLGVLGWIVGSRRGQRGLWLAGAVLMGVVLAKLLLVDRQHLGNLLGILSFMAYGVLCTAVGYFAPAPPRAAGPGPEPERSPA